MDRVEPGVPSLGDAKVGADEVTIPTFPPTRIVIDVPLDDEPRVTDDGGLASYLIEAILQRVAQQHSTVWAVEMEEEEQ